MPDEEALEMNARLREIILVLVALLIFHVSYLHAVPKDERPVEERLCYVLVKNQILKRCYY